jgi:hypothetical protein
LDYRPATFFLRSHQLDLPEFRSLDAKVSSHLDDLPGIHEVAGIGAKAVQGWGKLTTSHRLGQSQTQPAAFIWLKLQAKFTNTQTNTSFFRRPFATK